MGFASAVFIFGLLSLWSPQQAPSPRSICGTVQDQTGALVVGAAVELSTADTRLDAKTDAGGQFCFNHVESGEYELTVQSRGFQTNRQKVTLHEGESVHLTISLSLETVAQQVTVAEGSADVGSLNVAQTRSGFRAPSEFAKRKRECCAEFHLDPGDSWRCGGFEWCIPPARRARRDILQRRWAANLRPAEPDLFEPDLREHHSRYEDPPRRSSGRVWRQDQSHRGSDHAFGLERREVKRHDFDGLRIVCNTHGKRHPCIRLEHASGISWRWMASTATVSWTRQNFSLFMRGAMPKVYLIVLTGVPVTRPHST